MKHFTGHGYAVTSVGFSKTGSTAVSGSNDWTARVWDVASGRELARLDEGMHVQAVDLAPDGRTLMAASFGEATLWDIASGKRLRELRGNAEPLEHVEFSDDDNFVLTGGPGDGEQLWDLRTGRLVQWYKGTFPRTGWSLSYAAGGSYKLRMRDSEAEPMPAGWFDEPPGWKQPVMTPGIGGPAYLDLDNNDEYPPASETSGQETERSVGFIPSGACGSGDRKSLMGKVQAAMSGPLEFSSGCRFAAAGAADGTMRLWEVESGKQVATLIAFKDGGWAVTDGDGRFDTNRLEGDAPLQWVMSDDPMRALPLEIFMRDYFTPGLLTRIMSGETLPGIRSIAEIGNRVQPDVKVLSVTPSTIAGRVDVRVHAASHMDAEKKQASGLRDLRLFRDGQLAGSGFVDARLVDAQHNAGLKRVAGGYIEGALADGDYVFRGVMLKSGERKVTFTAYAFNTDRIKSATSSLDYDANAGAPKAAARPRAFLLQIGVNHYAAAGCELNDTVNDAEKMSAVLSERLKTQGYDVHAVKLESAAGGDTEAAGKHEIAKQLAAIAAQATPDDVFFMSFSGHGYSAEGGAFYILPSSLRGNCGHVDEALLQTAISADELADWLRPIDAGEMTLILDACSSAESVEAGGFKAGPMGSRGLGQLAYDKRMRILAASQPNQAARESSALHQGLLTYALTELGLVEGAADWRPQDNKITVGEWLGFAANNVPHLLESSGNKTGRGLIPEGAPVPTVKSGQIPAVFDFSRSDTFVLQ